MELCKEYKSMCFNEGREKLTEKFELDFQENLPQYLDDIERVIKCSVNSVVTNYDVSESRLTIHGKTIMCLTYLNKEQCALSTIFEEEFIRSIDVENSDSVCFADVKLNCNYSGFRLINQRRIDVHTALCANICVYRRNTGKCLVNCKNAFTKHMSVECLVNKCAGVSLADFDESFSISSSNSQIKNVVNSYGICYVEEIKIIKDKMLVKLKAEISIVYISDSNSVEKCAHSFSLSKIIDISDSAEDDKAFAQAVISGLYIKSKTNSDNVLNEFELVGTIAVNYRVFSVIQNDFITDSYMPRFNTEITREKLFVKEQPKYFCDNRSDELIFESDKSIIEIIDLKPLVESCTVTDSVMNMSVNLSFLYYDDSSQLCYFEKSAQLKFRLSDEKLEGEAAVNLISYDFVIKSADKVSLRLNYSYSAYLYKFKSIEYLTDIDALGEKNNLNIPELTLYFANKNEDVWNIAKSFSTDMSLIMEENNLSSQIIENKMVLLVPGM